METDYDTKGPGNAFKLRKYTAAGFFLRKKQEKQQKINQLDKLINRFQVEIKEAVNLKKV